MEISLQKTYAVFDSSASNTNRANTVAIAALVERGDLPIDTQGNVFSLTLADLARCRLGQAAATDFELG
jgi:hypothetical protein